MKFAALATHALAATGLFWSAAFASKTSSPIRGSAAVKDEGEGARLVELAHAIAVLQGAGIDVEAATANADLGWGKKPLPDEQLFGSVMELGVAGADVNSLSGPELAFLEDAVQFAFNEVNKGGDVQVTMVRLFNQVTEGEGNNATNVAASADEGSSSTNLGRNPYYTWWHTTGNMRCRMCRDERFLGSSVSVVDSSSPLVQAWEDKLTHVLQTSGFDAFAEVYDVHILTGSGIVTAFAGASKAAAAAAAALAASA